MDAEIMKIVNDINKRSLALYDSVKITESGENLIEVRLASIGKFCKVTIIPDGNHIKSCQITIVGDLTAKLSDILDQIV